MKRAEFLECVIHPNELPLGAGKELEEVIQLYPYFPGAYILHALALSQTKEIRFPEALKDAALHSGDRKHLFHLIHSPQKRIEKIELDDDSAAVVLEEASVKSSVQEEPEQQIQPKLLFEPALPVEAEILSQILTYPEIEREHRDEEIKATEQTQLIVETVEEIQYESVKSNEIAKTDSEGKHSFSFWLKKLKKETHIPEEAELSNTEVELSEERTAPTEQLIDRFIQTEPRISKPVRTEFFSPVSMAKRSVEDNEEIVSETLARIYAEQGNTDRAIRIYQKLSLLYPDKIDYFAALIQNLENPEFL
jgi:hypothetical protein